MQCQRSLCTGRFYSGGKSLKVCRGTAEVAGRYSVLKATIMADYPYRSERQMKEKH